MRAAERLLRIAALLVPRRRRPAWLRQWTAELTHRRRALGGSGGRHSGELRWCLGGLRHAAWLRARTLAPDGSLVQDLRFAARSLRRAPRYTLLGAGVLAVGIAANAAIFSVVDATLLRPLPYAEPGRLTLIWQLNHDWIESGDPFLASFGRSFPVSYPLYERWRRDTGEIFTDVVAFETGFHAVQGPEFPERVWGTGLAGAPLELLGVAPLHGRPLLPSDDRLGADRVVLLGHGLWRRQYGADPDLVGEPVVIDGVEHLVIGVMPPGFAFPYGRSELWTNLPDDERASDWDSQGLGVVARLRPGVDLEAARTRMAGLTRRLLEERPDLGNLGVRLSPLGDELVADIRPSLLMLLGAVGLVLLIACANVANLTLVRGVGRRRELAVRAALGAGKPRLLRQLLSESVLLALLGATVALPLTHWAIRPLSALLPTGAGALDVGVDPSVLAYSVGLAVLSGMLVGALPGLRTLGASRGAALRSGPRDTGGRSRTLGVLVVAEVALAVVLLVGAALLLSSFDRLARVEHGLEAEGLLTLDVELPERTYPDDAGVVAFVDAALTEVRRLPETAGAAMTSSLAFSGSESSTTIRRQGREGGHEVRQEQVSPGFFGTMGIPMRRGRAFDAADAAGAPPVVVVNETAARALWPDRDPLGQRLRKGSEGDPWATVVGVAADHRHKGLDRAIRPTVYFPLAQRPDRDLSLVVRAGRAGAHPRELVPAVRAALATADPTVPAADIRTMQERIAASTATPRLRTVLVTAMAGLAALLAVLGVYGVIAYTVQARVREIGVRMALGAARRRVVASVMGRGLTLALGGSLLGVLAAALLGRFMGSFLYGLDAWDPTSYLAAALLLVAAACVASWVPARRAARIDPATALRRD